MYTDDQHQEELKVRNWQQRRLETIREYIDENLSRDVRGLTPTLSKRRGGSISSNSLQWKKRSLF